MASTSKNALNAVDHTSVSIRKFNKSALSVEVARSANIRNKNTNVRIVRVMVSVSITFNEQLVRNVRVVVYVNIRESDIFARIVGLYTTVMLMENSRVDARSVINHKLKGQVSIMIQLWTYSLQSLHTCLSLMEMLFLSTNLITLVYLTM